jgi:ferredoxin
MNKVKVIRAKCESCGTCVAIAPQVFQLDDKGIATVISQDGHDDETKLMAAQSCPRMAIEVTDAETGQKIWPEQA